MGNPTIHPDALKASAEPGLSENGILARVGGVYISDGSKQLPTPGPGAGQEMAATVDMPSLGLVRITYRLNSYKHGRSTRWHWVAVRAQSLE